MKFQHTFAYISLVSTFIFVISQKIIHLKLWVFYFNQHRVVLTETFECTHFSCIVF